MSVGKFVRKKNAGKKIVGNKILHLQKSRHFLSTFFRMSSSVAHERRNSLERQGKEKLRDRISLSPTHLVNTLPTIKS